MAKETFLMAKETHISGKRDLHIRQMRLTYMAEGKRDLHIWQKRPTYMAKDTYICGI